MTEIEYREIRRLADATGDHALRERTRAAACLQGGDYLDCRCWICRMYGIESVHEFECIAAI